MALPIDAQNDLIAAFDAIQAALDRYRLHTDILSGQVTLDRVIDSIAVDILPDLQPYVDAALEAAANALDSANDANAFSIAAQHSANTAEAASASAQLAQGAAAASALDANNSAYAASVFAQFAQTASNSAGQFAAAAQVSALQANTKAAEANVSASAAFTSAVAAQSSANSSAASAAVAVQAQISANVSASSSEASAISANNSAVSANLSAAAASASSTLAANFAANAAANAASAYANALSSQASAVAANSSAASASANATLAAGYAANAAANAASAAANAVSAEASAVSANSSAAFAAANATLAATYAGQAAGNAASSAANAASAQASAVAANSSAAAASANASLSATYAGQANTAKNAARAAAKSTYPDNFTDPNNWENFGTWGGSSSFDGTKASTFLGGSINSTFNIPVVAGETYRLTMRHRVVNQGGGFTYLGVGLRNSTGGVVYSNIWTNIAHKPSAALGVWETSVGEITAATLLAAAPTATSMYIVALLGYDGVSDGEITSIKFDNITSEVSANASAVSATASAVSANNSAAAASANATLAAQYAANAAANAASSLASAVAANASASAASANASLAATYSTAANTAKNQAWSVQGNMDFAGGLEGWYDDLHGGSTTSTMIINSTYFSISNGFGWPSVLTSTSDAYIRNIKRVTPVPGRKYKFAARYGTYWNGSSGVSSQNYLGYYAYDESNTYLGSHWVLSDNVTLIDGQTATPAPVAIDGSVVLGLYPTTSYIQIVALLNYANNAVTSYLDYFTIEDITESYNANASATAASGSAVSANSSAAAASANASLAATYAGQAAGNAVAAQASATAASGSAVSANSSAAAAASSAIISAQVSAQMLNRNATFASWPSGSGTIPDYWADWAHGATNSKVQGYVSNNAIRFDTTGRSDMGIYTDPGTDNALGGINAAARYWVVEADVTLESGALIDAGVYFVLVNNVGAGLTGDTLSFATTPDSSGSAPGAGVAGRRYKYAKFFDMNGGSTQYGIRFYAMAAWTTFGAQTNKVITFHKVGVRAATQQEVEARQALANTTTLSASVSTLSGAVATLSGKTTAWLEQVVAAGNSTAAVKLRAEGSGNTSSSSIELQANAIRLLNGANTIPALDIANGVAQFSGTLRVGVGASGARVEITDNLIRVFDANNTMRVRLGVW